MENTELEYQGLILDENTISDADYMIGSDDKIKIPVNENAEKHFYNQANMKGKETSDKYNLYEDTRWSCGLFGSMGAISDLTGYKYTKEDQLRIHKKAVDGYGLTVPGGMKMSKAVDCVRDDWNEQNPDNQILSIRAVIGDSVFTDALQKGHSPVVGYRTSKEYYKDSQDDGVVSGEDFPKKGGHLVRTNYNSLIKIDDNYVGGKKYNTYTNNKIKKLVDSGVFFPSAYLFLKDITMADEIRNNIDLEKAKEMFDQGYWNGLNPRKAMSRQEVMTVLGRMKEDIIS